jgi:hypothetical protein
MVSMCGRAGLVYIRRRTESASSGDPIAGRYRRHERRGRLRAGTWLRPLCWGQVPFFRLFSRRRSRSGGDATLVSDAAWRRDEPEEEPVGYAICVPRI